MSTEEKKTPLRTGFTTGTYATLTALACTRLLLSGENDLKQTLSLPRGEQPNLILEKIRHIRPALAYASAIKDAGDDPDVTHQARIWAHVQIVSTPGLHLTGGEGVGLVTKKGLPVQVGQPAINPVPRAMMQQNLQCLAASLGYSLMPVQTPAQGNTPLGLAVTIGVENGRELARHTLNARLGILNGLSILGTTGIVRPYSCSSWIASVHRAIDVALTSGLDRLAACTGNTSEAFMRPHVGEEGLIEMGDFAGAVLKYLRHKALKHLDIAGGFAKMTKLAQGHLNLHSRHKGVDFNWLAAQAKDLGASDALQQQIASANTALEALTLCQQQQLNLPLHICKRACQFAHSVCPSVGTLSVWILSRDGQLLATHSNLSPQTRDG